MWLTITPDPKYFAKLADRVELTIERVNAEIYALEHRLRDM
jgi:hypothetical protein